MSWYCGSQETQTVDWSVFKWFVIVVKLCVRLFPVMTTPLGSEVLPDVYWRKAVEFGDSRVGVGGIGKALSDFRVESVTCQRRWVGKATWRARRRVSSGKVTLAPPCLPFLFLPCWRPRG